MKLPISILLLGLLLGGQPAAAEPQDASGASQALDEGKLQAETIIVTGTKPTRETLHKFVDALTIDTDGQIARFEQPVCPASFGLPESYNRVIEQRLRDDAAQIGLRVGDARCQPNVVIIVASAPDELVSALQRERPELFFGLEFGEVQQILKEKGRVRAWQVVEPRGSDGRPLERVSYLQYGDTVIYLGEGAWVNRGPVGSRIQGSVRPDLVSTFIVIDQDAVDGLTLTQIADYAAMRGLARTRFTPELHRRSILGVVDGADEDRSIEQLTAWDLAYLRALYRTSNTVSAQMQQSSIAGAMDRYLQRSPPSLRFAERRRDPNAGEMEQPCVTWLAARSIRERASFRPVSDVLACYDGELDSQTTDELGRWLSSAPAPPVLVVRSPGGDVDLGLRIGRAVLRSKATVSVFQLCASSCANYIFGVALHRVLLGNSLVLFHGGATPAFIQKLLAEARAKLTSLGVRPEKAAATLGSIRTKLETQLQDQRALMTEAGIDAAFLERFDRADREKMDASKCTSGAGPGALFLTRRQLKKIGIAVHGRVIEYPGEAAAVLHSIGAVEAAVCVAPSSLFEGTDE